jgi:hypothetical protein
LIGDGVDEQLDFELIWGGWVDELGRFLSRGKQLLRKDEEGVGDGFWRGED